MMKKSKRGRNFSHNPPTGELIFCLILTYVYTPHVHALMRESNMIEVSIIHTHTHTHALPQPIFYFMFFVALFLTTPLDIFFLYQ